MDDVPLLVAITFVAVVISAIGFLYYAFHAASAKKSNSPTIALTLILVWIFLLTTLTFNDFFLDFDSRPPRFLLIVLPPNIAALILLINRKSRTYLRKLPLTTITYIHIIRVPVEIVLWWLAAGSLFPLALTFEGVNFDIIAGITAPFAGVFLVGHKSNSRIGAIIWNILALILVLNIVIRAVMATPYFYDPSWYDVPNTGVFYFPYILLPGFVVPTVFFCHFLSLIKLWQKPED